MTERYVAGVDWAGGQWLAVVFEDQSFEETVLKDDFEDLWDELQPDLDLALVDVPIGLPEDEGTLEEREAVDSMARSHTGFPSSVFPVPSRETSKRAYEEDIEYEDLAQQNENDLEKGLSQQSASIAAGIGEVDMFLEQGEPNKDVLVESHPELCFRGLLGRRLEYSKKSASGVGERLEAIDEHVDDAGVLFKEAIADIDSGSSNVEVDDVLDAIVLGVTAWWPLEELLFLPEDPNTDENEVPMRMAFYAREPLPNSE